MEAAVGTLNRHRRSMNVLISDMMLDRRWDMAMNRRRSLLVLQGHSHKSNTAALNSNWAFPM